MDNLELDGAPWIMILGPKGAGKSRLASTLPNIFCLDTEPPGGASAYPKDYRKAFQSTPGLYGEVTSTVADIAKNSKRGERSIIWNGKNISALCIDTYDTLQKFLLSRYLSQKRAPARTDEIWAPKMEQSDWGMILNFQSRLITELKTIPIPVVWVAHTKVEDPLYEGKYESYHCKKRGRMGMDVSGSIENFIVNLCDYILHIVVTEEGTRRVITQPTVENDYIILAADRHRLFRNDKQNLTSFALTVGEDGFPTRKVLQYICENHVY